ncbi:MAG: DNA repair protein RadA, partial [Chloroflexi bacterium]|nr:DNA repair protein RadA [Chloroflexota bacterium]
MSRSKTQFVCQQCGRSTPRQMGRCPRCGAWNSMVEQVVAEPQARPAGHLPGAGQSTPRRLPDIDADAESRLPLNIEEFSRVLGGGIVPGSLVLVGGDPGIGKSTLMTQVAMLMAWSAGPVLYVSGEESERQIKMRALRLVRTVPRSARAVSREEQGRAPGQAPLPGEGNPGPGQEAAPAAASGLPHDLFIVTETNLDTILQHVESVKPRLLIVDSIQTVYLQDLTSAAGSVSQVRECAARLQRLAKGSGVAVFLIGHVTKEGTIAGPRVLEHIVDTVLYLEGDRYQAFRLLRSVKNRFGATSEVGVFEMREQGMVEVPNPSEVFLAERMVNAPGSAIAVTMEGTRPLLVEMQGLTSPTTFGNPRRTPNGVDFNRLLLLTAVLTRR